MGEFKYRFWVDGKMVLPNDPANDFIIHPTGTIQRWDKNQGRLVPVPGVIALLYAGPTDANDKEVCEADFLSFAGNKVGEVFYKKQTGSFQVRFASPKNDSTLTFFLQMNPDAKIIGNGLQNPELKKSIGNSEP
ncbi:MAG: hypothetical protein Q8R76_13040 [Candidatus Omnitrophota bacterium]|nr:hypothetical protein [Candidatus Omnitrophota bacterium]